MKDWLINKLWNITTNTNVLSVPGVLIFGLTVLTVIYFYFKWSCTYWSRRGVITPSHSFPLGNLADVLFGRVSFQTMFNNQYCQLKPKGIRYCGYYFLNKPILAVFDLELIKSILIKDFSHFTDHGIFDAKEYDPYSAHLFGLKGAEWKKMREKLTPLFTSGKLRMMFPTLENCSHGLVNLMDEAVQTSTAINVKDVAGRYTTDIIASVFFGIESNTLKNPVSDFRKYGERSVGNTDAIDRVNLFAQSLLPDVANMLKIPFLRKDIYDFFGNIVRGTIKYREENNVIRKDFMQLLIQLKNNINISDKTDQTNEFTLELNNNDNNNVNSKNEDTLTIEEIIAQAGFFFMAGYDTSSITTAFLMYELAFNQDIQDKVRNEIIDVLQNHKEITYNAVSEMTYMDKCVKETLRKYPILSQIFRRCTKSYKVPNSDLTIDKGVLVLITAQEVHYDPEYYPDPEKFDPERFSAENIGSRPSQTWLPFGEGPRICIGARLGMLQIKVAMVKFLSNYKYTLNSKTKYPLKRATRSLAVTADGGLWLDVEKINNNK